MGLTRRRQECLCYWRVLASKFGRAGSASRNKHNDDNDESVAKDAACARAIDGNGANADDGADGRAGARKDCVHLRDGFAHLWVGPLVAGADQAASDAGT